MPKTWSQESEGSRDLTVVAVGEKGSNNSGHLILIFSLQINTLLRCSQLSPPYLRQPNYKSAEAKYKKTLTLNASSICPEVISVLLHYSVFVFLYFIILLAQSRATRKCDGCERLARNYLMSACEIQRLNEALQSIHMFAFKRQVRYMNVGAFISVYLVK